MKTNQFEVIWTKKHWGFLDEVWCWISACYAILIPIVSGEWDCLSSTRQTWFRWSHPVNLHLLHPRSPCGRRHLPRHAVVHCWRRARCHALNKDSDTHAYTDTEIDKHVHIKNWIELVRKKTDRFSDHVNVAFETSLHFYEDLGNLNTPNINKSDTVLDATTI